MIPIDVLTILAFSAIVIATGISFKGSATSMTSFFAAGGSVPWYISGLSLFMGFFSAGTFVVWGSIAYRYGWVSVSIQWAMALAGFAVGCFIAPAWHKHKALTAAGFIQRRLGNNIQKAYTGLFLFVSLFTTGSFLYPVAKIVQVASGFPLEYCILSLGIACILYVSIGGLWAVVVTDVLQFVILFTAVIVVIPLSFKKIEGLSNFLSAAPSDFFNLVNGEYTWVFLVAFGIYNLFFLGGNWAYVQRYTSVASLRDARKVGLLFGALYIISPILWMLPPMMYRIYNPSLIGGADEGAYLLMCKEALPAGMLGLMLGGMIFATASSLNATLNISAGVFTNDIYKHLFPEASNKALLKVARASTVIIGLMAILVALLISRMGGIVHVVITIAALTGVPIYLPVIWSLFSKRMNGVHILSITLFSLFTNLLAKFAGPAVGISLSREKEMLLGTLLPIGMLILLELYLYFKDYQDPQFTRYLQDKEGREVKEASIDKAILTDSSNLYGKRIIGLSVGAAGLLITILGVIADVGRGIVIPMGILLAAFGLVVYLKNLKGRQ